MGYCKTCRWWVPRARPEYLDEGETVESCIASGASFGCMNDTVTKLAGDLSNLCTMPDFGCIFHEEAAK